MLGKVVSMKPAALQKKRENKNTVALDSEQNAIQVRMCCNQCGQSGMIYSGYCFLELRILPCYLSILK